MDLQSSPQAPPSRGLDGEAAADRTPARASSQASSDGAPEPSRERTAAGVRLGAIASDREVLKQARLAFERGDDDTALASLSRVADHGVPFADVHYMIGMLRERRGEVDGALESLKHAVRLNPAYVEALLALASLHERTGDFERSRGYAERASQLSRPAAGELDPTTRGKLANQQAALADALANAGERRAAIEQYRGALERCPTFHDIRHRLAVTLREAGLPHQAAQELRRIGRLQPSMLVSQIQLGLTYYSMGRTPEAIAEWEAVLEKDPSRDEARMYLRLVRGKTRRADFAGSMRTSEMAEPTAAPDITSPTNPASDSAATLRELDSIRGWQTTELQSREPADRRDGSEDPTA